MPCPARAFLRHALNEGDEGFFGRRVVPGWQRTLRGYSPGEQNQGGHGPAPLAADILPPSPQDSTKSLFLLGGQSFDYPQAAATFLDE
jgi:hypothetical protein